MPAAAAAVEDEDEAPDEDEDEQEEAVKAASCCIRIFDLLGVLGNDGPLAADAEPLKVTRR